MLGICDINLQISSVRCTAVYTIKRTCPSSHSDFHLPLHFRKFLDVQCFDDDDMVEVSVASWITLQAGIFMLADKHLYLFTTNIFMCKVTMQKHLVMCFKIYMHICPHLNHVLLVQLRTFFQNNFKNQFFLVLVPANAENY